MAVLTAGALVALAGCGDDDDAGTTTTAETTTTTTEATTTTTEAPTCAVDEVLAEVDATLQLVGLAAGGDWSEATPEVAFAERTVSPEQYREDLALDCGAEMAQTTDAGAERLLLAAWTGERIVFVLQASDARRRRSRRPPPLTCCSSSRGASTSRGRTGPTATSARSGRPPSTRGRAS